MPPKFQMKKWVKFAIIFLTMAAVTICSGYYNRRSMGEGSVFFQINLPQSAEQTVVVDIGNQNWAKYLFQPGRLRVGGRINATGDLANKQTNLLVTTKISADTISFRPYSRNMTVTNQGYQTVLSPGRNRGSMFELNISRQNLKTREIGSVVVQYIDKDQERLLGQVTFIIRNSRS